MVFSFVSLSNRSKTEESIQNITSLLRYAKAESANTGRRFQVDLTEDATNILSFEPNPLAAPGKYKNFYSYFSDNITNNLTEITIDIMNKINFYPDGSCDSLSFLISDKIDTNVLYKISIDEIGRITDKIIDIEKEDIEDPSQKIYGPPKISD